MVRPRSVGPTAFVVGSLLLHGAAGGGAAWLAHRARASEQARKAEPKPVFAGESFDVSAFAEKQTAAIPTDQAPTERAAEASPRLVHAPRAPRPGTATTTTAAPDEPATYGATGDRSAVDVVVAISRGFPQAASTDPIWAAVPLGSAGEATMEIEIDADGNLLRWSLDPGASLALRQGMVRTMALVGGRAFLAHGAVTTLHVSARVSTDAVHDGNDSVYALHSEHEGKTASAYFSLSIGRRVDLVLREGP
jgi:hypothetical protein